MALYTTMLESVGTLKRPIITRDARQGVVQEPFEIIQQDIPCSVQPAGASVVTLYAQRNVNVNTRIFLVDDIGAEVNDIFIASDVNDEGVTISTNTFMVRGFERNLYLRHLSPYFLDCERIR